MTAPPAWQLAELRNADGTAIAPSEQAVTGTRATRRRAATSAQAAQRGMPGWLALVVLLVITAIGGLIDAVAGDSIKGAFAIGLIVGGLVAILLVRRSGMFPIVVAPPLIYFIASAVLLLVRSGGFSDRKVLYDAAANWLVYGFPAIAGATAVVLIIAGIRMIIRR